MCKSCNTERLRKYRATKAGQLAVKRARDKYMANHRTEIKIWGDAKNKIKKQKPCIFCKKFPTVRHHPDYSHPLKVLFVCAYHHKYVHKLMERNRILI